MFSTAKTPSEEEKKRSNGKDIIEGGEGGVGEAVNVAKKKKLTGSSSSHSSYCRADECGVDLSMAKSYNRRHKVCDKHAKAPVVLLSSIRQRFCQQCSKFHELVQFDDTKRSCRKTLAEHNERRRKARLLGNDQHQSSD